MEENDGDSKPATGEEQQGTPPAEGADKGGKPDRKDWIPRDQFDKLVQTQAGLAETVAELATAIKAGHTPKETEKPKPEDKVLTRADLRAAVEKQQLTQEDADNIWDKQLLEQAKKAGREAASQEVTVKRTTERVEEELRRYRAVVPNAWKEGTEERTKLTEEFQYLVGTGSPGESKATELAAMRAAFGPVEKLGKVRSTPAVDADDSTAGGGEAGEKGKKDPVKVLDARQRAYYQKGIEQGRYKSWDAVREELSFKKARV